MGCAVSKADFLAQLVEWGYDPNQMLVGQWDESGFHTVDPSAPVSAEVNGEGYVASYFQSWKAPEHYEFVVSFYSAR